MLPWSWSDLPLAPPFHALDRLAGTTGFLDLIGRHVSWKIEEWGDEKCVEKDGQGFLWCGQGLVDS